MSVEGTKLVGEFHNVCWDSSGLTVKNSEVVGKVGPIVHTVFRSLGDLLPEERENVRKHLRTRGIKPIISFSKRV